jgi:hypothetical protein
MSLNTKLFLPKRDMSSSSGDRGSGRRSPFDSALGRKRRTGGSRLIERALTLELEGKVRVHYKPSGLVCMTDTPMHARREEPEGYGDQSEIDTGFDS